MTDNAIKTILCMSSYEKGQDFLRECKQQGWRVILLTASDLEQANWPRESLDDIFFMPDLSNTGDVIKAVTYLARTRSFDRIVALDDYDVPTAATLREHMRVPGMGETTVRYFRDKLAMRQKALEEEFPVPDFVAILNHSSIHDYTKRISPPWMLKPRMEASTIGITKINAAEELWPRLDVLGDQQSYYLLERYIPGDVFHVDSLVVDSQVLFAEAHQYGRPPLDVFHGGGITTSRTVPRDSADERALKNLSQHIIAAFGLVRGVTHMEFIKGRDDGHFYFLETASRVGGGNTVDMVEAATGINLWREWARIETASPEHPYQLPPHKQGYAGVIITLARQEYPDTSAYQEPEIISRMNKRHHAGFVIAADTPERVKSQLDEYSQRFIRDFSATLPPFESRPPSITP